MLQFQSPQYLYLLLLIPFLLLIYFYSLWKHKKQLSKLGDEQLIHALMPGKSNIRKHTKFALLLLALTALVFTIARPLYGLKQQTDTASGIEVVVMVDVSNSMLANDVTPSRLDRSKLLVTNMVDKMKNDKVALGVFAGEAYPQLPITSDYASAKMFIDALSTDMVTLQGTDIASAIELGCRSFTDKKDVGKAIILITDGENHEGGAEEAAKEANKKGINVYVIGVGTAEGGEIQTPNGPLTDENGQIVHTALNEEMCRKIAQAGHGIYLHLDQSNSAQKELRTQLSQLKQASSTTSYTARNEQFQAIAIIVILLLIIEACLNETKNSFFQRIKLFKR